MLKIKCNCDDSERTIKNIYVFTNGEKYSGQKIVLNQNRWHHILNQITLKLDPYFGKVEKLYTTSSGLTVCSFTDLKSNATYVASNRVRRISNVKGGYTLDTEPTQEYFEHYLSSQLQRVNKNKKLLYVRRDLLVIYIFRNGECGQSFKIVLTSEDLSSWNNILSFIALIIDVPERCIKSLYSINGNKICGPWELQHGASYVAVGYNQSYRQGCYHVDQKSTEVLTTGYPVVHKDKNLICAHKKKRKMKQNLKWNHYEEYTCMPVLTQKSSKKSSKKSRASSKRCCSQAGSSDLENTNLKNKPKQTCTQSDCPKFEKHNKKVTVHMRIKNPVASSVTITRNSGDSSPATRKKKQEWKDEDTSGSDELLTDETYANCNRCHCKPKICSKSSKQNKHENNSDPTSQGSSEIDTSTYKDNKKKTERNLSWKHAKKRESQDAIDKTKKVCVHIRRGKAVICGGASDDENMIDTFAVKKSNQNKKYDQNQGRKSESENNETENSTSKSNKTKNDSNQECASSCGKNEDCKFYKIAKPTMDKYKTVRCSYASSNSNPITKQTYLKTILKHRDNSESRLKNRNRLRTCKESAKCQEAHKRQSFIKKMSTFLFDSNSSIDSSSKEKNSSRNKTSDTDENSFGIEPQDSSSPSASSSCTICRFQQERRHLTKRSK